MRVVVATDAWHPQVNGVVRTLTSTAAAASKLGIDISFVTPEGFPTLPLPTYTDIRLALPLGAGVAGRLNEFSWDAIHIATEGPIGIAARRYCLRRGIPFTTSYTTRFPEYIAARLPVPEAWTYALLHGFHRKAAVTMVSTASLAGELRQRGFSNLGLWTRGVDTQLFTPQGATPLDLPRPIFLSAGRVAVEKNLEAFLSLDLPGSKVVVGDGPQLAELRQRFPQAIFFGMRSGPDLAAAIAAADVFVFPSLTDTFGVVQLEALACGVPVAAFPVMGPRDVIGNTTVGVLDADLRTACLAALQIPRQSCRDFALAHSWETSTREFLGHLCTVNAASSVRVDPLRQAHAAP